MQSSSDFRPDKWGIIKNWLEDNQTDIVLVVGIILISLISFGLGRLTAPKMNKETVIIENQGANILNSLEQGINVPGENNATNSGAVNVSQFAPSATNNNQGIIVASKNGKKYHWPWCSFAKKIKPENQIWFKSEAAAQKAGYSACGSFTKLAPAGYKP